MPLLNDFYTPAELTGYVREAMEDYERKKGSLAQWLPNRTVADIIVKLWKGQSGLVDEAHFRAYGAEPEIGAAPPLEQVIVALQPLGTNIPLDEYTKLRTRNASDEMIKRHIERQATRAVQAVADRIERLRGIVLATGKATIDQYNLKVEDDFGRDADLTVTAGTKWDQSGAKVLEDLRAWSDKYDETNGTRPGTILVSAKVARAIAAAKEFQTRFADGASRPASLDQVNDVLYGEGLPLITRYTRRTKAGAVLPDNLLLFLPEAVGIDDYEDTELGATYWGETESAHKPGWNIEEGEEPGIVVAAFEGEKPGQPTEVISDAIALPALANANLSMACEVI